MDYKEILDKYNKKLKDITTFEELKALEEELYNLGIGALLRTRRAKWHAYGFDDAGNGKVSYLLSDSVSHRVQYIRDLWKYIEVALSAR